MKLKEMKKEELEVLSYTDLTELILKENKNSMNTPSIFKKICELLDLDEENYMNQIGDYYTSLTTDKRFILLDNSEWDLKEKHKVEIDLIEAVADDDDETFDEDNEDEDNEMLEESEDESIEITDDEIDLDDDMDDLTIVDDEDMEEEM